MKKQTTSKQARPVDNRPVTILARYFIKASGRVCYKVRNGESKEYQCCLHSNGATSCTCKAGEQGTRCYHVKAVQARERARLLSIGMQACGQIGQFIVEAEAEIAQSIQEQEEAIESAKSEQEYRDMGYLVAPKPGKLQCPWQKQYASDPREKMLSAPLNGDHAFSLLKR